MKISELVVIKYSIRYAELSDKIEYFRSDNSILLLKDKRN